MRGWVLIFGLACAVGARAQEAPAGPAAADSAEAKKAEEKPLPNLASLLERAKQRADALQELRKNYICKEVVVADEFDSKGNKKGTHSNEYQVFFVEKTEVQQHVAHDGKPLPENEAKKEQEQVDKRIADIKAHKVKERGGMVLRASSLLRLATVSEPRREMVNGRPTILFDYKGNPAAKADGMGEEVMKKLAGTIELDEQEAAIVRLTGTLQENFHVLGGLAVNLKKGSRFELESARVNDEIWFTKTFSGHVDGRILLFKGFDGDAHVSFSDYRKMRTSVTLLPGSQVIGEDGKPVVPEEVSKPKP